jgi:hypothetical protein
MGGGCLGDLLSPCASAAEPAIERGDATSGAGKVWVPVRSGKEPGPPAGAGRRPVTGRSAEGTCQSAATALGKRRARGGGEAPAVESDSVTTGRDATGRVATGYVAGGGVAGGVAAGEVVLGCGGGGVAAGGVAPGCFSSGGVAAGGVSPGEVRPGCVAGGGVACGCGAGPGVASGGVAAGAFAASSCPTRPVGSVVDGAVIGFLCARPGVPLAVVLNPPAAPL